MSAVGAADIQRQNIKLPTDLVKSVPGLQAAPGYGGNPVYTLRGVGFNTQNINSSAPVGLYVDEASLPYPYMSNGVLFDLERVEVLKGPQGTLYGRNATGGLIDFIPAKPTSTFAAGATLEGGNYATVNGEGFVSGPVTDWLRLRLSARTENRWDGWQHSVTRDDSLGRLHRNAVRLSADIGSGGPLTAQITGSYWRQTGDTQAPQAIALTPEGQANTAFIPSGALASIISHPTSPGQTDWTPYSYQPQANVGLVRPRNRVNSEFASVTGKISYAFTPDIKLVSLTSYDYLKFFLAEDAAGLSSQDLFAKNTGHINSVSEELRLVGETGKLNWSLGGYYAHDTTYEDDLGYGADNSEINLLRAVAISVAPLFPQYNYTPTQIEQSFANYHDVGSIDTTVKAAFANADYKFSDLLKVTVGGRYTSDSASLNACSYDTNGLNTAVANLVFPILTGNFGLVARPNECYTLNSDYSAFLPIVKEHQSQHNFAWRAAVDITPSAATLIYLTISRGYKAGGFPIIAASNVEQFNPVKQEKLTAYEGGAKLGLFDRHVQLNVSAFYYQYQNKQVFGAVQDLIFGALSRIVNIPRSHEYGAEGDVTWRLSTSLTANAALTYLHTKITEYSGFDEFGQPGNFAGRPFAYTPKWQGNAGLIYDTPLTDTLRANASANVHFQSSEHADFSGLALFDIKSYAVVDATIGISGANKKWSATLYSSNLFNKYYWNTVIGSVDTVIRYAGMPRQFGLRLSYRY